jgi:SAM-dependent methyltransferase
MKKISSDKNLAYLIESDAYLAGVNIDSLRANYDEIARFFHYGLDFKFPEDQFENAIFHKIRYLDLLSRGFSGNVLDVGNDKPFLSFLLRRINPGAVFHTISYEIPNTPFDLYEVDIEQEEFPFPADFFQQVIFTEVIEHLWRDPSFVVSEINRVLSESGRCHVTTPNACDRHSLVCVLWQANPNQRSGYFATLESGHLHLWTLASLTAMFECHSFVVAEAETRDLYGHTIFDPTIEEFISKVSPFPHLMHETLVLDVIKSGRCSGPSYPREIFPDGVPVQKKGALLGFLAK